MRIKDIQASGINHALKYSWALLDKQVRRRYMRASERDRQLALISGTTDYQGFAHRDVVIEAVFEDLALKQRMVAEIEQHCGPETIFASNTSSLPIAGIAAQASRPQRVIGLHYFSPVEKCRWWRLSRTSIRTRRPSPRWSGWQKCRAKRRSWWRIKPASTLTAFSPLH